MLPKLTTVTSHRILQDQLESSRSHTSRTPLPAHDIYADRSQLPNSVPLLAGNQMSESQVPTLKIPANPVNLRHGEQHRWRGLPFLAIIAEEEDLGQLGQDEQYSDRYTHESATDTDLSTSSLGPPLQTINPGPGPEPSHSEREVSVNQTEIIEIDLGEAERNTQEVDGEIEQKSERNHRAREWFTDDQISAFISYTCACLTAVPPRPLVTFYTIRTFTSPHPSPACLMLREASRDGIAQLVRSSDRTEVYSVGAPPPVQPTGLGEHWWLGLTPAQVRAGPLAEQRNVRNAERSIQRDTQAKKERTRWLNEQQAKTAEGVRRQEAGISMSDDVNEHRRGKRAGRRE